LALEDKKSLQMGIAVFTDFLAVDKVHATRQDSKLFDLLDVTLGIIVYCETKPRGFRHGSEKCLG